MGVTAFRPVVPKGRSGDGTFALVVFLFALLMHVGLRPVVLLCVLTMFTRGALYRQALHRNLFNVGQHVLTLVAAWAVLRAFSINPSVANPWSFREPNINVVQLVAVLLAGLVYLIVNNGSVYVAVMLHEGLSLWHIVRDDARHLAVVGVAMVSLAPLVLVVMVHLWPFVPLFYPALVSLYHNATLSIAREHDALHDSLTGLGNRELLHREGSRALEAINRQGDGVAIFVLDLDKFKEVNDTLGHSAGDRLLQVVTERLLGAVRPDDVVARLGGDEFVVIVRGCRTPPSPGSPPSGCSTASTAPARSMGARSSSPPASAWPSVPRTASSSTRCCGAPTAPCTSRSPAAAASRSSTRAATRSGGTRPSS
jgi:GGDEF domain-containing protein